MSDFLEKVKMSKREELTTNAYENITVIQNKTLQKFSNIGVDQHSRDFELEALKASMREMQSKVICQDQTIASLNKQIEKKELNLEELKAKWCKVMNDMSKDQKELAYKVKISRDECDSLKVENASAKEVRTRPCTWPCF